MGFVSRGFQGKRRGEGPEGRLPPGQYLTDGFPVLSAGPTPQTPLDEWTFTIEGGAEPVSLDVGRVPGAARARPSRWTSTA